MPSGGANSKLMGYIREHRWEFIIGIIATVIVGYVFFRAQSGSAGTSGNAGASNAAPGGSLNNQGSLAAAGYDTSGVAYALTQESQQLTDLQNQLNTMGVPGTTTNTTNVTNTQVPAKWSLAPVFGSGTKIFQNATGAWMAQTSSGQSYTLLGPKSAPGSGILPQGTVIEKGGQGRYWYVEPGQYEQALTPTNGYTGNVLGVSKLSSGIYTVNTPQNPGTKNA